MKDVVLVCMPFGPVFAPSIGLSLLKAGLAARGVVAPVRYFSIAFAERIGQSFYCGIATEERPATIELAGEWIFSHALFGPAAGDERAYVQEILRKDSPWASEADPASPALVERILRARSRVEDFLSWCVEELIADEPRLVGFTSVFQQHAASLALARRLKQRRPDVFVVLGGANCEGPMGAETVRQFPFVDAAVSGEGDRVFPELVQRVLESRSPSGLAGVRTRDTLEAEFASRHFSSAAPVIDLDALPYPDYRDYFREFRASRFGREWQPTVFLETSRGCWWGERKRCTFCGLNGQTMSYRSKSSRRAVDEIVHLTRRHPGCDLQATDNMLDLGYFDDVVPELAARRPNVPLLYETKANLKKGQVRSLRAAGITRLQPGVESFSDAVLNLMRKGVTGLQNIQILKWCSELAVEAFWNFLWGFPGEPPEEYARMAKLVPLLTHLPAPTGFGKIRLDRFSPHFDQAESFGFTDVAPIAPYRHVYPMPAEALNNLAYYFSFRYREPRDVESYAAALEKELWAWRRQGQRSALFSVDLGDRLLIWDLRPAASEALTVLGPVDRILYQTADAACTVGHLAQAAQERCRSPLDADEVTRRFEPLLARGLIVKDTSRYLALAIPLGEYSPPAPAVERFRELARQLGRRCSGELVIPLDRPVISPGASRRLRVARRPRRHRAQQRLDPSAFSVNERGELVVRLSHG